MTTRNHIRNAPLCLISGLTLILISSCSSRQNSIPQTPQPLRAQDATLEVLAPQQDSLVPRQRRVYVDRAGKRVLHSVESDFNGDSRIDFVQYYDQTGTWIQTEKADLSGKGFFDVSFIHQWNSSRNEAVLEQEIFDTNYDGKADLWKYFSSSGSLIERRLDRNHDGKPDYWEYYENGQVIRIEQDRDGDGVPDSAPRPRIRRN